MDLAGIPNGTRVFVDTNIFDFHFRGKSACCTAFVTRVAMGEVTAYVNTQVLSDLLHKMMLAEAAAKGFCAYGTKHLKPWLAANRADAGRLAECQRQLENLLSLGIKVVRISKQLLMETKAERTSFGLMTGDSLHLGCMNRHTPQIQDIATHDGDFAHITTLTVWKPMDVVT